LGKAARRRAWAAIALRATGFAALDPGCAGARAMFTCPRRRLRVHTPKLRARRWPHELLRECAAIDDFSSRTPR